MVTSNRRVDVERCLRSLVDCTVSATVEVVVVDNASRDGTPAMVRASFPDARLIENTQNLGSARGSNQGMAAARGELILLIDSDAYVVDDVVGRAARHLLERPEIGMLGCALRFPDGRLQHSAHRALSIWRGLVRNLWLYRMLPAHRRAEALLGGYWEEDREIEVDWLSGTFLLLRRELFDHSRGFDPGFAAYGEDCEWGMRLSRLGHRIWYAPQLGIAYHVGSYNTDPDFTQEEWLQRCHQGGIDAYASLNGWRRAAMYRLSELLGVTVRLGVYSVASLLSSNDYYATQARLYRSLVSFYLFSARKAAPRLAD